MLLETLDFLKRTIVMMTIQLMFAGFALMLTPADKTQFLGAGGVPLVAMLGFIFSVALGIFATKGLKSGK